MGSKGLWKGSLQDFVVKLTFLLDVNERIYLEISDFSST